MIRTGFLKAAFPVTERLPFLFPLAIAMLLLFGATGLTGCSQMTLLRTHELRQVETQVQETRKELAALQKSVDDLNLQQGGSTNKMRADLTSILTELQGQISRLHSEIDETQHRLSQLNQKLDKLDQRKVVKVAADTAAGKNTPATEKVVPGLDLEHLFGQSREDYIRGRYDLAYQGFKAIYEKTDAGAWREQSLYWMAECLLRGEKPERALDFFQRVYTEFPEGSQRCAARLKVGLMYQQRDDIAKRNESLNQLIADCPQSNEAERAKEILKP
jgi:TolA-binding protein